MSKKTHNMRTRHYTVLHSLLVLLAAGLGLALPQLHGASTSSSQPIPSTNVGGGRKLTGKFLHITGMSDAVR